MWMRWLSIVSNATKNREIIIVKELGRWEEENIWDGGNNYYFIKLEFETLRHCYERHRVDRWIEVRICGKMSRIKIENWSHQELKSWEEMRSLGRVHSMRTVGRGWTAGEYHNLRDELRKRSLENKSHLTGPQFLSWWDGMTLITLTIFPGHVETLENNFLVFGIFFSMSNNYYLPQVSYVRSRTHMLCWQPPPARFEG